MKLLLKAVNRPNTQGSPEFYATIETDKGESVGDAMLRFCAMFQNAQTVSLVDGNPRNYEIAVSM